MKIFLYLGLFSILGQLSECDVGATPFALSRLVNTIYQAGNFGVPKGDRENEKVSKLLQLLGVVCVSISRKVCGLS